MQRPTLEQASAPNPAAAIPKIKLRLSPLIEVAPALLQDRQARADRRCSELLRMVPSQSATDAGPNHTFFP